MSTSSPSCESSASTQNVSLKSEAPSQAVTGTVLIVEDESSLAEILEFNLNRHGFRTLMAADGLEACRIVGREKPDLILLDIMLPLLDGWDICRMIRNHQDEGVKGTPIMMLSALGSDKDKEKGHSLGADLYLPKPYSIKEVILQSRNLIARRQENTLN